jgi:hypothetical protein
MKLLISEILEKVNQAKTEQEKISILRVNYSPALEDVFKWTYDPNVFFFISEIPLYTPDQAPDGLSFTSLYNEHKRFYLFHKNYKISSDKKTILLIQMLEALGAKEAKILEYTIKKNIPGLSYDLVNKAYPNFLANPIKIPVEI